MKVTFSPMIVEASGHAGPIVASRWKGRPYFRSRVTPANPQTDDQVTQRNYMSKAVGWWHDIKLHIKPACDALAESYSISGFNAFIQRNVRDMAAEVDERLIPLNTAENPIADDLAGAAGASGEIDLTWSQGEATDGRTCFLLVEPTATPAGESAIAPGVVAGGAAVEDEAATIEGLTPATEYNVWLCAANIGESTFSIARKATATSGA